MITVSTKLVWRIQVSPILLRMRRTGETRVSKDWGERDPRYVCPLDWEYELLKGGDCQRSFPRGVVTVRRDADVRGHADVRGDAEVRRGVQ